MGDGDDAARELLEEPLEPGHRLGVEVVRGLVEEQHVGRLQQQAAQGDPALLAAGERRDVGVARGQAQRVHRELDLLVEVPEVLGVDLVLQPRELVGGFVRVVGRDLLVALQDLPLLRHRLLDVLEDVLAGVELRLLGQVADARALGGEGLAGEVLVHPGHDPQERRLAGPVRAEDADLGVAVEGEPDPLEDLLSLGGDLAQVLHGEDELGHVSPRVEPCIVTRRRPIGAAPRRIDVAGRRGWAGFAGPVKSCAISELTGSLGRTHLS